MTWSNTIDLTRVLNGVRDGGNRGLKLGGEHVLDVAVAHTPIEEGTLSRTGKVSTDEAALKAAVSFDGPYAVVQHEDLTLRHDPGRTAKFLENAFNSQRMVIAQIITTSIRRELGA
ncbi:MULTISPECIES: hypothetical protein [unclassified Nocardioides]|uniref:hypothetical protein n=1 Tax=unclassified Nocardioides TaxID=2615069 RepID=UPI0009EFBF3A|nr:MULTISPECIES: hypothetical protein [unclassified Nocardioides]GAW50612.1 uncharacterized protein PD653B2_2948 [Nocardioides sp. PD653-B2]GAW55511.1 uncharacterized protein PD653_2936 [Nocardioides sp. PD653]